MHDLLGGPEAACAPLQWTASARDNLKFLATLERHFETLHTGPLAGLGDVLPPLMGALRMVWIISRHYGDDERMGSLFGRIATQIGDRIEAAVSLQVCLRWQHAAARQHAAPGCPCPSSAARGARQPPQVPCHGSSRAASARGPGQVPSVGWGLGSDCPARPQELFTLPEADALRILGDLCDIDHKWFSAYMEVRPVHTAPALLSCPCTTHIRCVPAGSRSLERLHASLQPRGAASALGRSHLAASPPAARLLQMREKIEAGGRDARWEFSKTVLFERTAHQAAVCADLAACVKTVATFRRFLSPDLRIVTGDTTVRLGHGWLARPAMCMAWAAPGR